MGIVVGNRRQKAVGDYIGRPSPLGNPFAIGADGTRAEVIEKYRTWLDDRLQHDGRVRAELMRLVAKYRREGQLTLVCWCAPKPCHGDVIALVIEEIAARDR